MWEEEAAQKFKNHYERLKLLTEDGTSGFEEEFNYIEKTSSDQSFFGDYTSAHKGNNRSKNRYANVLPLEDSRVVLNGLMEFPGADYINANFVSGKETGDRAYIATQGPLENTAADFWRMIWEQKVKVVVMLTKVVENGRTKCFHYYPKRGKPMRINEAGHVFELSLENKQKMSHMIERTILLTLLSSPLEKKKGPKSHIVHHFQYTEWPDHGLPESTAAFRELLALVDAYNNNNNLQNNKTDHLTDSKNHQNNQESPEQNNDGQNHFSEEKKSNAYSDSDSEKPDAMEVDTKEKKKKPDYSDEDSNDDDEEDSDQSDDDSDSDSEENPKSPIVVHCSAGIGRTGTFCTVHSILSKLAEQKSQQSQVPDLDILNRILQLRKERIGMVQTREQYEFCYKTILEALEETQGQEPR